VGLFSYSTLEDDMAEQRNPLEMTEEEIAEANGEPLSERRAMSVGGEVEPLPPARTDEVPGLSVEDPPPAR
jgi:hypothetical protein